MPKLSPATNHTLQLDARYYTIALICPLPIELTAARLMLGTEYKTPRLNILDDDNQYTCGSINGHNVFLLAYRYKNPVWSMQVILSIH